MPWFAGCGGISGFAAADFAGSVLATSTTLLVSALATTALDVSGTSGRVGGMALVTGVVGWGEPAEASFTCPALTWTVFTLTGFIGSDEPGIADIAWAWITPLVIGAGSGLGTAAVAAAKIEREADARAGAAATGAADATSMVPGGCAGCGRDAGSDSATSALASEPLRSVIAVTVRAVDAFSRFSASRLRMMASREPPLRPPSTTPTRWRLPRRIEVTRLKPDARV